MFVVGRVVILDKPQMWTTYIFLDWIWTTCIFFRFFFSSDSRVVRLSASVSQIQGCRARAE